MALEQAWQVLKAGIHYTRDGRAIGSGPDGSVTAEDLIASRKAQDAAARAREAARGAREAARGAREAAATAREQAGPDGLSGDRKYYSGYNQPFGPSGINTTVLPDDGDI